MTDLSKLLNCSIHLMILGENYISSEGIGSMSSKNFFYNKLKRMHFMQFKTQETLEPNNFNVLTLISYLKVENWENISKIPSNLEP